MIFQKNFEFKVTRYSSSVGQSSNGIKNVYVFENRTKYHYHVIDEFAEKTRRIHLMYRSLKKNEKCRYN